MTMAQQGNGIVQRAAPWVALKDDASEETRADSFAGLALALRIVRSLAITLQPFMPASSQRLWDMLGETGAVSEVRWGEAVDLDVPLSEPTLAPTPLFERLDLAAILEREGLVAEAHAPASEAPSVTGVKGGKKEKKDVKSMEREGISTIDFEQFTAVDMRVARVTSVEAHPDADRLWVVSLDDGSETGRTICAGLRDVYAAEDLLGLHVVVVANLAPRKLRGIMSEGMMLAADDGEGVVRLLTVLDAIAPGAQVR